MAGFTAIAAGVGLATTAATTGASFAQAGKQRRLMKEAEAEAEKSMMEARRRTEVNYFEDLAIAKESYRQAYEAGSVAAAQAIQAIQEGDVRGVAAGVGGIEQAALQQANQVRAAQEQEMINRQKLIAQEDSRLRDINVQLDLQEVQGAQLAARDAQEAQNLAIEQGIAGVASMGQQAMDFIPLFKKQGDPSKVTQGFDYRKGESVLVGGKRRDKKAYQEQFDKSVEAGLKSLEKADKNYQGVDLEGLKFTSDIKDFGDYNLGDYKIKMEDVITNQQEGDAFRGFVLDNYPDYAKSLKKKFGSPLDRSGAFDNKYIRDAYSIYGPEYIKTL